MPIVSLQNMTAWIGIIGTVVGALLAGGAAWFNARSQIRRQDERDRKKYILSKLEELYEAITQLERHYQQLTITEMMSLALVDRKLEKPPDVQPLPLNKIQMLVGFYAPELEPLLELLLKCRDDYGAVITRRFELMYHEPEPQVEEAMKKCLADFRDRGLSLSQVCESLQKALILLSKKYI
jgi:hypothetical protein